MAKVERIGIIPFVSGPRSERINPRNDHDVFAIVFTGDIESIEFDLLDTPNGYSAQEGLDYLKAHGMKEFLNWTGYREPLDAICYGVVKEEAHSFAPTRGLAVQDKIDIYIIDQEDKILFEATQTRYDIISEVLPNMAQRFAKTISTLQKKRVSP